MLLKIKLLTILLLFIRLTSYSQSETNIIEVSDDIKIVKLSDNAYLHISFLQTENWGKVGANGLLLVKNDKALMIDTSWNDELTKELCNWTKDSLNTTVTTIIPTHWHEDCMGGLNYLQSIGVTSYANQKTIDIAKEKGLPVPQHGFSNSLMIDFESIPVECYYFGAAHTIDVIAVWLPTEKILFAGDIAKDINSTTLGNTADADINAWSGTLRKVIEKFTNAEIVIAGHGEIGDKELLIHTQKLLDNK
ncbi:subclass B1 metallo-beta-lactamase [Dysgonomonas sp. Marseille-P4677]|uniref:subclass B1 metallo-beta-lactamase n=1 Tax=Dysgonomonas sp. Marseille-P4677 TaxID=2364790 RepID=UPI001911B99B|nr:subclass B1 metallo-beta-lactamase [Dysgonomonas sp. Marseille-P4677]MBK5722945.1 subclass B1 metallo-beta-lactamase [Dysgonomonas sp. Marseille-P4677]